MNFNMYIFDGTFTVGYCFECDEQAVYTDEKGLYCPKCETQDLSIFEWKESSICPV